MEAFKERLLEELEELTERKTKLNNFIENEDKFKNIATDQQRLLIEQCAFMRGYAQCLSARVCSLITDEEIAEYKVRKLNK